MTNSETVDFGLVELPSKGECYPSKTSVVRVECLTASDENIIMSGKLREGRTMCDVLLRKKMSGNEVSADDLCIGDREAILLWLRRTGYGDWYTYTDGDGNERNIDLSGIAFREFNYFGDENGYFDYECANGDNVKYRLLTHRDEMEITDAVLSFEEEADKDRTELEEYIGTARLILFHCTMSVNGKTDKTGVEEWLAGLDFETLRGYLRFIQFNSPGTDPDTTGGLEIGDSLFYDIK